MDIWFDVAGLFPQFYPLNISFFSSTTLISDLQSLAISLRGENVHKNSVNQKHARGSWNMKVIDYARSCIKALASKNFYSTYIF